MKTNFRKKKLLLINPFNSYQKGVIFDTNTISPPLGLGIISALTPDNWDIEILDENFNEFKYKDADLIGLTALTSAVNRAYDIAGIYKQKGIPTVIGGIHASMLPDEALKYVDTVVIGEAESVWPQLIKDFENKKLKRVYQGELLSLENLPIPRRDLFHPGYNKSNIQTSRGCPMNCDFCSVHTFNGNKYRHRPIKNVLDELEKIKHDNVFVVDDNIIGYSKKSTERAIKLFKGIIDRGIKKDWVCQASLNFADNEEVLKYAAESGCKLVLIGIESEKIIQLQETNKKLNLKIGVDNYQKIFQKIHKYGISVLGAFIYGYDTDSKQDLFNRTDYILNSNIDAVQSTILTPLPGTRLFDKLVKEDRLLYSNFPKDWERYFFMEVVHKPKLMTAEELQEAIVENWKILYEKKLMQRKLLKSIKLTKNIKAAVWAYFANLERHNLCLGKKIHPVDIEKMLSGLRKS
jgi:radical SAM superfamily enzyme YgiQ (UPF0313 family)